MASPISAQFSAREGPRGARGAGAGCGSSSSRLVSIVKPQALGQQREGKKLTAKNLAHQHTSSAFARRSAATVLLWAAHTTLCCLISGITKALLRRICKKRCPRHQKYHSAPRGRRDGRAHVARDPPVAAGLRRVSLLSDVGAPAPRGLSTADGIVPAPTHKWRQRVQTTFSRRSPRQLPRA